MANSENFNAPESLVSSASGRSLPTLESGLEALQQKNYPVAIAQLEQVAKTAKQPSVRVKAQMGLVNAYERSVQLQRALLGCQRLQANKNPKVKSWATQKLATLHRRYPYLEAVCASASEESANESKPNQAKPVAQPKDLATPAAASDLTGFQPFVGDRRSASNSPHRSIASQTDAPSTTPPPTVDETGFVPFNADASTRSRSVSHNNSESLASMHKANANQTPSQSQSPGALEKHDPSAQSSSGAEADPPSGAAIEAPDLSQSLGDSEFENPFASLDELVSETGDRPNTASPPASAPLQASSQAAETDGHPSTVAKLEPPGRIPPVIRPSERARQWKPLQSANGPVFLLSCGWMAIALVALLTLAIQIALATADPVWNGLARFISPPRIEVLDDHPTRVVIVGLLGLLLLSPWLMQWILGQFYGANRLSERELERRSPETLRLLKRVSQNNQISKPQLHLLPTDIPIIFSYGHLPRTTHITVSRGLLTQLSDDEIASLYAAELGHMLQRDLVPMTLAALVQQFPFLLYWKVAQWGDRQRQGVLKAIANGIAAAAYGLFWLLRLPSLWLSRVRQPLGDRHAASLTGNPNGQMRALLNLSVGLAQAIERQRSTEPQLEGLESLMPVSYRQALTLGSLHLKQQSLYRSQAEAHSHPSAQVEPESSDAVVHIPPTVTLPPFLAWDVQNPYRRWLTLNTTHPPLGDRLYHLAQYALQWRIRPDLELSPRPASKPSPSKPFWLQVIPYAAPLIGIGAAIVLWLAGGIARTANISAIEWLWGDRSLLWGCVAIGFSFGTLIRINSFFPDITNSNAQPETQLPHLLRAFRPTPVDSVPVKWTGKLLGRPSISNGLNQDLMLRTAHGSIKLHYLSHIGPLGNLILGKAHPADFIGKSVTITGWFRRGATPWIDVETLKPDRRAGIRSGHPLWSTLLAVAATLWGTYVIYNGSF